MAHSVFVWRPSPRKWLQVDGTADERITIRGAGGSSNREDVVIRGGGEGRVFQIQHDYYTIEVRVVLSRRLQSQGSSAQSVVKYQTVVCIALSLSPTGLVRTFIVFVYCPFIL